MSEKISWPHEPDEDNNQVGLIIRQNTLARRNRKEPSRFISVREQREEHPWRLSEGELGRLLNVPKIVENNA